MAGLTTFAQQKILDHLMGDTSWTMPTTYVGLFTAAPSDAGGGTECTGGSYARSASAGKFSAASGTAKTNSSTVTFPTATGGGYGTATHFGIFDASSGGNLLAWGALGGSLACGVGVTPSFAIGDLDLTLD